MAAQAVHPDWCTRSHTDGRHVSPPAVVWSTANATITVHCTQGPDDRQPVIVLVVLRPDGVSSLTLPADQARSVEAGLLSLFGKIGGKR